MARDDDFDDDDFSLDDDGDGSEEEFSAASEDDVDDGDDDEAGSDDAVSDVLESDFDDDDAPKSKRGKRAAPAAKSKSVPAAKRAATSAAKKAASSSASAKKAPAAKTKSSPAKKSPSSAPASKAAAGPPPVPTIKAADAKGAVLDYMRKTNRPYSMLNVFENMHRAIAKPSLTKILDDLCDKEELVGKTYGKAKIYYANQAKLPVPSADERAAIEQQIRETEDACVALEQELRAGEAALAGINAQLSDADLATALAALEDEQRALESKLASLERPGQQPIAPGRKDALKRKFTTYRTAWVQRKRIVVDAVNQIADGMEKKPKAVYDLVGIETDADAGVKEVPPAI